MRFSTDALLIRIRENYIYTFLTICLYIYIVVTDYLQTRQSLHCSHTQSMDVDEGSYQKLGLLPSCINQHVHLKKAFARI